MFWSFVEEMAERSRGGAMRSQLTRTHNKFDSTASKGCEVRHRLGRYIELNIVRSYCLS